MANVNTPLIKQANILFYHGFFSHTWTFTQASWKRNTTLHFHPSTNIQTFSYRDVYSLFLIDLFVITRLVSFIHHLQDLHLTLPGLSFLENQRTEGRRGGWLVVPHNLKVKNSSKNLLFFKESWQEYSSIYNKSKYKK